VTRGRKYKSKIYEKWYGEKYVPKGSKMIAFRREVLEALLASPKWRSKLERAKTDGEAAKIILAFAEEKGFVVKRVNEPRMYRMEVKYPDRTDNQRLHSGGCGLKRRMRGKLEITAAILRVAREGGKKTHLAYGAYISPAALNDYLVPLTKAGLIKREGRTFRTTDKGLEFLRLFEKLRLLLSFESE